MIRRFFRLNLEEVSVWHAIRMELKRVVSWLVKELFELLMACVIILWIFYAEVVDPCKLTYDITLRRYFRVVGHPGAFDLILFIWVKLTFGRKYD